MSFCKPGVTIVLWLRGVLDVVFPFNSEKAQGMPRCGWLFVLSLLALVFVADDNDLPLGLSYLLLAP